LNSSLPYIRDGRVRALAVTTLKRSPAAPEVPTLDELGYKGVDVMTFTGVFAPAGLSSELRDMLSAALAKVVASAAARDRWRQMGVEPMEMSAEAFRSYLAADIARWKAIAKAKNISIQ
jgi:tripartite-type tricarboxylate transporter receptor subunit TctC